jgi:large subunit ribosomal protein L32
MTECPNCGELKLAHRVCKACGTYKGKEVINN